MSDISSIKIGDTIYSIKDNIARNNIGTEFPIIYGTQTAATGAWTGVAPFDSLVDGQKILYFLPFAGSYLFCIKNDNSIWFWKFYSFNISC